MIIPPWIPPIFTFPTTILRSHHLTYLAHGRRIEVARVPQHVADAGRVANEVSVVEDEAVRDEAVTDGAAVRHEGSLEGRDVADQGEAVALAEAAQVPARRHYLCKILLRHVSGHVHVVVVRVLYMYHLSFVICIQLHIPYP